MDLGLAGVPVAVAGASKGLGFAVALELAREGARVAICSRQGRALEHAAGLIKQETGTEVLAYAADVSKGKEAEDFIGAAAGGLGGLQVLVANAGGPPPGTANQFTDKQWLQTFEQNFLSAVRLARAAIPYLDRQPWGRILAITSSAAKQTAPELALSSAVRAATTGFAKSLAAELGPRNITVNCLMPGQIATDRLASLAGAPPGAGPDHPAFSKMAQQIPLGRVGRPEEFSAAAAFFCSSRASFITGVSLQVDGGLVRSLF